MEKPPKKLLEQVRGVIRLKHYSYKQKKVILIVLNATSYFMINGIPEKWMEKKLKNFSLLNAVKENVAASTQNQALNAI